MVFAELAKRTDHEFKFVLRYLTASMVTVLDVPEHWQARASESGSTDGSRPGASRLLQLHSEAQAASSCTIHAAAAAARACRDPSGSRLKSEDCHRPQIMIRT